MYIKADKSTLFLTKDRELDQTPILFIHGFTGSSQSWKTIRNEIDIPSISIDIPGHNKSTFNNFKNLYYFKDFANELYMALNEINVKELHICGYSLGGRLAISFAAKYPSMIKSLLLESTSLGIEDRDIREERYQKDLNISTSISENLNEFVKNWESNKLFEMQETRNKPEYDNQREIRTSHNKDQLSNSLKTFSVGNMPYMLRQYQKFNFPISIINGKDDINYIKEGRIMLKLNNNSKQYIINNASHNVHLENKEMYLDVFSDIYN